MKFPDPLIRGKLIKRYKRFMADIELENGDIVVAHCANSGSMLSVQDPGSEVWISPARNPDRKLKFTWELIRIGEAWVGINTSHPNALVFEAIADGTISELQGYESQRREVKYGKNSRIDILLENPDGAKCYVEIKNVTMKRNLDRTAPAEFPDGVTARGAKHLVELSDMVADGHRAVMLYLVQRDDCDGFNLARDIDPEYGAAYDKATAAGVEVLGYTCKISEKEISVTGRVEALG
ncbi:MAG: DNA/RNA nuclease SfsA [Rhodospirillales bacterium]|nr:DNA/RNA nuclease SfsA [Rhodospirillales bacterium]